MSHPYKVHLSHDPIMKTLVEKHEIKHYWGGQPNYFLDLAEIVTGQQLSMKAADAIFKRLLDLFPDKPTPQQILSLSIDQLRALGFSRPKGSYIHNIATAVVEGSLPVDQLDLLTDEEVAAKVTAMAITAPMVVPAATAMVTAATAATAPPAAAATGLNFLLDEGKARH